MIKGVTNLYNLIEAVEQENTIEKMINRRKKYIKDCVTINIERKRKETIVSFEKIIFFKYHILNFLKISYKFPFK